MDRKLDRSRVANGGRPATGSIVWADEEKTLPVGVRVSRATGKRMLVRFDPGTTRDDAIAIAPLLAERGRVAVDEGTGETVAEYADRWLAERVARGIASSRMHDRGRLRKHAFPILGPLAARTFGREDVERFVADLDRKIRLEADDDEHLSWKTASNVWVLVSKMCKDMADAKRRELRVREDNPAARVHPPERGEARAKNYLYPSEFQRLIECPAIGVKFRALYAVAVYTYARGGELAALEWPDVDLEHGVIHVTKSVDAETHKVKSTKTGTTRRVPIEPHLRPLLQRLHDERTSKSGDRVLWLPDHEDRAALLREHLKVASVERAELFANDVGSKHITFHDLRATGITWAAVRGDDPLRIKQRAGHKAFSTTEGYIREAENLRDGFGSVFPPLPPDLLAVRPGGVLARVLAKAKTQRTNQPNLPASKWSNGGSNPGPLHCERSALPAELLPRTRRCQRRHAPGRQRRGNIRSRLLKSSARRRALAGSPGPSPSFARYRYPSISAFARRPHPSIATKSSSLKGKLTCVGLIICMPRASSTFDTTRSITRNGR